MYSATPNQNRPRYVKRTLTNMRQVTFIFANVFAGTKTAICFWLFSRQKAVSNWRISFLLKNYYQRIECIRIIIHLYQNLFCQKLFQNHWNRLIESVQKYFLIRCFQESSPLFCPNLCPQICLFVGLLHCHNRLKFSKEDES